MTRLVTIGVTALGLLAGCADRPEPMLEAPGPSVPWGAVEREVPSSPMILNDSGAVPEGPPPDAPVVPPPPIEDLDSDHVADSQDNCLGVYNPAQNDHDSDGVGDRCDDDDDGDGLLDEADNCSRAANPQQEDEDDDGYGDLCDNCVSVPNPLQEDFDRDRIGDDCDADADGDYAIDTTDNCLFLRNDAQLNFDGDPLGDACDDDDDGDGLLDLEDPCPLYPELGPDLDGDSLPDGCDPDMDGDNVDNLYDNCVDLANPSQADSDRDDIGDSCDPEMCSCTTTLFCDLTACASVQAFPVYVEFMHSTGQAFGDLDGDGRPDLYLTNAGGTNYAFRYRGDSTFEDLTIPGLTLVNHVSTGVTIVDYDNDGDRDIFVLGDGPNVLLRNDGTEFVDATSTTGLGTGGASTTAAWGDYDGDGWLDVYVANYVYDRDRLFHSTGDGAFEDVSTLMPLNLTNGPGYSATWADLDNDGDADLYVVNDKGNTMPLSPDGPTNRAVLWRNDGAGCGGWCFTDITESVGADARLDGMGLAVGDYDADGFFDLALTNIGQQVLLSGGTSYTDVSIDAGMPSEGMAWGLVFFDLDHDAALDLYIGFTSGANTVLRNEGTHFTELGVASGAASEGGTFGVAKGDYDRDGAIDLILGNKGQGYQLLRGRPNAEGRWVGFTLEGTGAVNRDAVGTRVTLTTTDGRTQMDEVVCGSSHGAGSDLALHFGLGDADISQVQIRWPTGEVENVVATAGTYNHVVYSGP